MTDYDIEALSDGHGVRQDGDDYIIETPFATARVSLKDANDDATAQLRDDREWPSDVSLPEQWLIAWEELVTTIKTAKREEKL